MQEAVSRALITNYLARLLTKIGRCQLRIGSAWQISRSLQFYLRRRPKCNLFLPTPMTLLRHLKLTLQSLVSRKQMVRLLTFLSRTQVRSYLIRTIVIRRVVLILKVLKISIRALYLTREKMWIINKLITNRFLLKIKITLAIHHHLNRLSSTTSRSFSY